MLLKLDELIDKICEKNHIYFILLSQDRCVSVLESLPPINRKRLQRK